MEDKFEPISGTRYYTRNGQGKYEKIKDTELYLAVGRGTKQDDDDFYKRAQAPIAFTRRTVAKGGNKRRR